MNSVHLIGRLATDIDLKEVTGGSNRLLRNDASPPECAGHAQG
ncbi:MAG: hypothetical protein M5U22_14165 [Thermoleophilia bacterium]|nr:hypothetical protein [Thermoleophilia bacterium]